MKTSCKFITKSVKTFVYTKTSQQKPGGLRNNKTMASGFTFAGSEYTDGKIDVKEGIYFGLDASSDHPDVVAGLPIVGANQYPDEDDVPGFTATVKSYMERMTGIG